MKRLISLVCLLIILGFGNLFAEDIILAEGNVGDTFVFAIAKVDTFLNGEPVPMAGGQVLYSIQYVFQGDTLDLFDINPVHLEFDEHNLAPKTIVPNDQKFNKAGTYELFARAYWNVPTNSEGNRSIPGLINTKDKYYIILQATDDTRVLGEVHLIQIGGQ